MRGQNKVATEVEANYFTSFDGCQLFYNAQEKSTDTALVILHGLGEHIERYEELLLCLADLRLSIYLFDYRGHGQSHGARVYVERFEDYVRDVQCFQDFIKDKTAKRIKRFIVLGHSLGGLIAAATVLENQSCWSSLILMSPFFGVPFGDLFLTKLCFILDLIAPRKIWDNPISSCYLTHDGTQTDLYRVDSLIQRRITLRLAKEMFRACCIVRARAAELKIPVAIFASGDDRIVSLAQTRSFFNRVKSGRKKLVVFDGFYHELLHEKERQKPIRCLKEYLSNMGL
jgi:alpha-beta hydrolase superfamily lysophospholipase